MATLSSSTVATSDRSTGVGKLAGRRRCAGRDLRAAGTDDQAGDLVDRRQLALGRDRDARAVGLELAGRDGDVVGLQHAEDLLDADARIRRAWPDRG